MRFKITLKIDSLSIHDIAIETARQLNLILGHNNKWHDLQVKPYSCSLIMGGTIDKDIINFKASPAFFYLNTEDEEVIDVIVSNPTISFDILNIKTYKGFNLLSVKKIIFNKNGKRIWVTEENKNEFIEYVKNKYVVDIEILKIKNMLVSYKNKSKLPVSNLLIKSNSNKNVNNLFESGIGGSCAIGFGFVEPLTNK